MPKKSNLNKNDSTTRMLLLVALPALILTVIVAVILLGQNEYLGAKTVSSNDRACYYKKKISNRVYSPECKETSSKECDKLGGGKGKDGCQKYLVRNTQCADKPYSIKTTTVSRKCGKAGNDANNFNILRGMCLDQLERISRCPAGQDSGDIGRPTNICNDRIVNSWSLTDECWMTCATVYTCTPNPTYAPYPDPT